MLLAPCSAKLSAQSPPCRRKASPAATLANAFFRLRASPAKTSGGNVASCASTSAKARASGYSGICFSGRLRQLSGVQADVRDLDMTNSLSENRYLCARSRLRRYIHRRAANSNDILTRHAFAFPRRESHPGRARRNLNRPKRGRGECRALWQHSQPCVRMKEARKLKSPRVRQDNPAFPHATIDPDQRTDATSRQSLTLTRRRRTAYRDMPTTREKPARASPSERFDPQRYFV